MRFFVRYNCNFRRNRGTISRKLQKADNRKGTAARVPMVRCILKVIGLFQKKGASKMATIKDIAAMAGVTPTTVSNVLHNRTNRVSPDTVEKVRAIIQKTGYVPNMSARALVGSRSKMIGVISSLVPLSAGGFFQDPFHAVLLSGIEQSVRDQGYYLMVRTVEDVRELNSLLSNWKIDGLIMTGTFPERFYQELESMKTPFVQVDAPEDAQGPAHQIG